LDENSGVVRDELSRRSSVCVQFAGEFVDLLLTASGENVECRPRIEWVFLVRNVPAWHEQPKLPKLPEPRLDFAFRHLDGDSELTEECCPNQLGPLEQCPIDRNSLLGQPQRLEQEL
jgi:hypothetical protein